MFLMRVSLILAAALAAFGLPASAEVIRCADAAGKVSYTDGSCPPGARKVARVTTTDPIAIVGGEREPAPVVPSTAPDHDSSVAATPPQTPSGPIIIDGRRTGSGAAGRSDESRWSDRGEDPTWIDDGYYYSPGVNRPPARPRDMRPRITSCGDRTCKDVQGNHWDRNTGQLDRYRSIDGRTCSPVGSTFFCR
jgi:hypothetical protein